MSAFEIVESEIMGTYLTPFFRNGLCGDNGRSLCGGRVFSFVTISNTQILKCQSQLTKDTRYSQLAVNEKRKEYVYR